MLETTEKKKRDSCHVRISRERWQKDRMKLLNAIATKGGTREVTNPVLKLRYELSQKLGGVTQPQFAVMLGRPSVHAKNRISRYECGAIEPPMEVVEDMKDLAEANGIDWDYNWKEVYGNVDSAVDGTHQPVE